MDANLFHDIIMERSVTDILHLVKQTSLDWYRKKQSTVETVTYGSEFTAARIGVDQINTKRNLLRYLGIPIRHVSYIFGDNWSVVNSAMAPHTKLHKRHNFLSFHRVRESIAAKILKFILLPGAINPADILSKHWRHQDVKKSVQTYILWGWHNRFI